jgi:branched-chain amino acid transport system ATP-binding protein
VCLIPEGRGVFPNLSVRENILMDTFASNGRSHRELEDRTYERFPRLGDRRSQLAGTLSGGEQQMLSLARALTTDPALILLDELSMGLAPIVVAQLFEVVRELAAGGVTIVVVEQFAGVIEFVDELAILVQGRIRYLGNPQEMAEKLASAYLGATA